MRRLSPLNPLKRPRRLVEKQVACLKSSPRLGRYVQDIQHSPQRLSALVQKLREDDQ